MNPLAEFFASSVDYSNTPINSTIRVPSEAQRTKDGPRGKPASARKVGQRVCDRCIVKKVKCDMKEPACSRCLEAESPCIYSVKKRKPGPVKGSKHARRKTSTKSQQSSHRSSLSDVSSPGSSRSGEIAVQQINSWSFEQLSQTNGLGTVPSLLPITDSQAPHPYPIPIPSPLGLRSIPAPFGIPPSVDRQKALLEHFFMHIHPSIPLFHQERFLARYEAGSLSQHLLLTICVVTAKVMGLSSFWDGSSLEDCIAHLLDLKVIENEGAGKALSLDNFRQACLLAFYAFHQYPGERAWMRISTLARKAYQCGLHQIDHHAAGSLFDPDRITAADLEEWRYVWWCIFCLDCYSNVTAATPFIIEAESIKTGLVTISLSGPITDLSAAALPRYLPDDTEMLWKTVREVPVSSSAINFNMHILTTVLIREAATLLRLRKQSTSKKLKARLADLENHSSAFRLALPARYLNASRNAFVDESCSEHHTRLICVLHIHLARALTYLPSDPQENLDEWTTRWQQCLECSQDVVEIAKKWDGQYFTATDPAICFIITFIWTLLHLHSCAAEVQLEFKVRLETYKDVLILFLEQFASAWSLPRFLISSCEQFRKMAQGPLSPADIDRILKVSTGPIHYRWLNFLSLTEDFQSLNNPARMYEDMFSQEWDSNDWEALMPIPRA